jgi:hypothetical protein
LLDGLDKGESLKSITSKLEGEELYKFINVLALKKEFLGRFRDVNRLFKKETGPSYGDKKLYSLLHVLAKGKYTGTDKLNYYLVMSKGANINLQNDYGNTPCHEAASNGNIDFIRYAIKKNANLKIKNIQGKTPLDLAKESLAKIESKIERFNSYELTSYKMSTGPTKKLKNNLEEIISILSLSKLQNKEFVIKGRDDRRTDNFNFFNR